MPTELGGLPNCGRPSHLTYGPPHHSEPRSASELPIDHPLSTSGVSADATKPLGLYDGAPARRLLCASVGGGAQTAR